jgi:hypothetical protein
MHTGAPIIRAAVIAFVAGLAAGCSAKDGQSRTCVMVPTQAEADKLLALSGWQISHGPFRLKPDATNRVNVAVFEAAADNSQILQLRMSWQQSADCWTQPVSVLIDGKREFGVKSKTLTPVSVFTENVDGKPGKELVLIYSAYIDGTGDDEKKATAIIDVSDKSPKRLHVLEGKFQGVADIRQFRQRAKTVPRNK